MSLPGQQLPVQDVDALINELEAEYTAVREYGVDAMPVTNNCTKATLTLGQCCHTQ